MSNDASLSPFDSESLAKLDYAEAAEYQKSLVEKRYRDEIPDTLLFLEHFPVVTQGRGLQGTGKKPGERHVPVGDLPAAISFYESERGGDLTYHGPGQLVIYPIVKLNGHGFGPRRDIEAYIRRLEQVLIDWLATYSIKANRRESATGIWIGDRKLASIGIAVKKWVTFHGIAINVKNDLTPFSYFSPCGFNPDVMIRLRDLSEKLKNHCDQPNWREWLEWELYSSFCDSPRTTADKNFQNP